ncbi:hypothetical protein EI546_05070 [Aequorivita sp. H23M31]|uniref:Uncharacterized protein n=1 Tax=Aequorivita ciconiae TaxID=2494375 RepID=A0A410G1J4_9FLAO|nr:hypothetical protein [Aequorivita sp. H23M31]QAA81137.1 hypothetical protein EI546_05070 [Aequorivita sp. H23M31]
MRIITLLLLLVSINLLGQNEIENLKINWPEKYEWKIGSNQETEQMHFIELVPGNESIDKWSVIGTMMSIKGATNVPMDVAANLMYEQAKANAPKAKLNIIEKNETGENHWILFTIEAPKFKNDKNPESQLYYIIQGKSSLYSNFVAIKEKKLSKDFIDEWSKVFKASELVYQ